MNARTMLMIVALLQGIPCFAAAKHQNIEMLIEQVAQRYPRMPEGFLRKIITMESGGNPRAKGLAGEIGLMQIKPSTARFVASDILRLPKQVVLDLWDPETNLSLGSALLNWLYDRYDGDPMFVIAGYNCGWHCADYFFNKYRLSGKSKEIFSARLPKFTRRYVAAVLGIRPPVVRKAIARPGRTSVRVVRAIAPMPEVIPAARSFNRS